MNHSRRYISILAALATGMLALGTVPAFAEPIPPDNLPLLSQHTAPAHLATSGGMSGWQITLIAVGAALLAGILAVIADRARTARRHTAGIARIVRDKAEA
jgi:hypothetical protein